MWWSNTGLVFIVKSRQPRYILYSSVISVCVYLCFLCKEPALMGSCPFWFPAILANKYCCCCRPNCMCDFSVDNFFDKCIYALSKKCCPFGVVKTNFFPGLRTRSAAPRRNDRNWTLCRSTSTNQKLFKPKCIGRPPQKQTTDQTILSLNFS